MAVLSQMSTCFDSTSACYYVIWGLALQLLGPMDRWDSEWVQEANICVNIIIGNLWRRFHFVFSNWPWRLHIIVDVEIDMATRRAVAQEFLDTALCCLGELCSMGSAASWLEAEAAAYALFGTGEEVAHHVEFEWLPQCQDVRR